MYLLQVRVLAAIVDNILKSIHISLNVLNASLSIRQCPQ